MQATTAPSGTFARRLYDLLNGPNSAKRQYQPKKNNPENRWTYGKAFPTRLRSFQAHLAGNTTQALSIVSGGFANFICWDLDENFEALLPFFADRLRARGWEHAAFSTTGSSAGRGKIVLTFKPRIPQAVAHRVANEIFHEVLNEPKIVTFGERHPSVFPSLGSGGNVRILGRNRGREGPLESPLSLDGKLSDLKYVKPVRIEYDRAEAALRQPTRWASELIESASTVSSNKEGYKITVRLADDALRLTADDEPGAVALLFSWTSDMATRATGNAARQFAQKAAAERAVRYVLTHREGKPPAAVSWIPLDLSNERIPKGPKRVYESLAQYAVANRLNPHCFGMDYGRLAALVGYTDKSRTKRTADKAEDIRSFLFRLDRGSKHGDSLKGLVTLWCLRGTGETLQDAYDEGICSDMFRERVELAGEPRIKLVAGKKIGFPNRELIAA